MGKSLIIHVIMERGCKELFSNVFLLNIYPVCSWYETKKNYDPPYPS